MFLALVLNKLRVLEVRGNKIKTLPATVSHLVSLERIMIEMNELRELPPQICELPKLGFLCASRFSPKSVQNIQKMMEFHTKNVKKTMFVLYRHRLQPADGAAGVHRPAADRRPLAAW